MAWEQFIWLLLLRGLEILFLIRRSVCFVVKLRFCLNQLWTILASFSLTWHRCRSRQFLGVQRYFAWISPKFAWKAFMRQIFSLRIFCSCLYFALYHVAIDLKIENLALKIGFYPPEKSTLGYARTLSEVSWISILEHLPHGSEVFYSHSSNCWQKGTSSNLVEVDLKLLLSLKTYVWHISYYLYFVTVCWLSQYYLFNYTNM